jgi:hypothetical protein
MLRCLVGVRLIGQFRKQHATVVTQRGRNLIDDDGGTHVFQSGSGRGTDPGLWVNCTHLAVSTRRSHTQAQSDQRFLRIFM